LTTPIWPSARLICTHNGLLASLLMLPRAYPPSWAETFARIIHRIPNTQ